MVQLEKFEINLVLDRRDDGVEALQTHRIECSVIVLSSAIHIRRPLFHSPEILRWYAQARSQSRDRNHELV